MREIEIPLGSVIDEANVEELVEGTLHQLGLSITLRNTLKKYPGSIHWHAKKGTVPGTLEVTFWPSAGRAWLTIQDGRRAPWIDDLLAPLVKGIQNASDS